MNYVRENNNKDYKSTEKIQISNITISRVRSSDYYSTNLQLQTF